MYASSETRDADIERGRAPPPGRAARRPARAARPASTPRPRRRPTGRARSTLRNGVTDSASRIPFRRWVEVELHHVDLGIGYELEDLPEEFVEPGDRLPGGTVRRAPRRRPPRRRSPTDGRAVDHGRRRGRRPGHRPRHGRRPPRLALRAPRRLRAHRAKAAACPRCPRYRLRHMTYSGAVKVGGPRGRARADGPDDLQGRGRPDEQQRLSAALPGHRRAAADRRGRTRPETLLRLIGDDGIASVVTTHQHGDHWQALRRGGGGHRRAHVRRAVRRRGHPGPDRRPGRGRRHDPGRAGRADRPPPGRPHPGLHRAGLRRPARRTRTCSPGTASSPAASATPTRTRRRSRACSTTWRPSSSTSCRTRPGSTRATATTPRSAPSARTCRSGASAAGEPPERRTAGCPVGPRPSVCRSGATSRAPTFSLSSFVLVLLRALRRRGLLPGGDAGW